MNNFENRVSLFIQKVVLITIHEFSEFQQSFIYHAFQGAYDYCSGLGGVLPSYDFFDVFNVNERPRNSENSTTTLNPPSEIVPGTRPTVELDNTFFEVSGFEIHIRFVHIYISYPIIGQV